MNDGLRALRDRFVDRCRGDLVRLRRLAGGDLLAPELHDLAHSLAGAGAVFGHPEVSEAAGRLDDAYVLHRTPERAEVDALIAILERVVGAAD